MATLLLVGGTVIDGTGAPARRADVRIEGDRIAAVGRLQREPGDTILDCGGLVVAPGFIDTHSHADGGLLEMPTADTHIRQGITTSIVGQDGGSQLPLAEWLGRVASARVALNIASFVGHGTVRGQVLGEDYKRPSTPDEVRRMRALVAREMQAGALGLSSGLEYDPGLYSTTEEVIALAEIAGIYGGLYISHVRDEENDAIASFRELIRVAREARLPAQVSHIKLGASPVWGRAKETLNLMATARRQGLDITADVYPYTYWQSGLVVLMPPEYGIKAKSSSSGWEDRPGWEKALQEIGGARNILVTGYAPDTARQGKTIAELAEQQKTDAVSLIHDMMKATNGRVGVVVTAMQEADLKTFLRDPHIMLCTDGGLKPSHPRGSGSYPRVLGRYVREERVIPLEEAVRKMTSLPARRMGFKDRGVVGVGKKADLTLFDPKRILDTATTKDPTAAPIGLPHVFVNGVAVLRDGKVTGERSGQVLRR